MTDSSAASRSGPTLVLDKVAKSFGQVVALKSGSLELENGSIHALIGENGAGKSTIVKIIAGLYQRDSGRFEYLGEPVDFTTTAQSKDAGIAVIYQEPTLFPDLSVTENIFMGRQPTLSMGRIDRKAMREETERLFEQLGVRVDPDHPTRGLSIADQQLVEIAKAISLDARVLIMDEPTAALSGVEVERLFAVARGLRDEGRALMFISHRFDEVFALCDTVTVMRDGEYIATSAIAETSVDALVRQMVGRDVTNMFPKEVAEIGEVAMSVEGLTRTGVFHDVSFEVRSGEILALAGLVGAGRSEIVRAAFGVDPYDEGTVTVAGARLRPGDPSAAMAHGVALIPEDRRKQGAVLESGIARNITLATRGRLARGGLIWNALENDSAQEWASRLEVKATALDTLAGTLSGGNQQKVVIAKWLATEPRVLIVDEPTRGIDVGTKAEVHRLLSDLAGQGLAIITISSELPEVLGMADRVLVVHEGRITGEFSREEATPEAVMHAATHKLEDVR
ncbi:sugar ABC transporter ATP-binding protein [Demequina pelophila]|uniref:sugar ABC transporter ATP-binding protein n=1 Tax=Demequina pelophila TaxID=1638984 RepID=UPI0007840069|nr:sugar ABC transporter ATP-binding protein [Demequina pelophila]